MPPKNGNTVWNLSEFLFAAGMAMQFSQKSPGDFTLFYGGRQFDREAPVRRGLAADQLLT